MKKKVIIVIIILLLSTLSIIKISYKKIKPIEEKKISIMIETDTGYEKSTSDSWPDLKKYEYDSKLSSCEKGSIEFDSEEGKIILKTKSIDKCKIYFYKLGTKEHPYKINTIEDLVDLSNDVNSGITYAGEYFILSKDLDFSNPSDYENSLRTDYGDINGNSNNTEGLLLELTTGSGFVPIGSSETNSFQGNFEGSNKTIKNLYIGSSGDVGFFGRIKNSKIHSLTVTGEITNATRAGIIGYGYGTTEISNVNNYIDIISDKAGGSLGGIIAIISGNVTIKNSYNYGKISNTNDTGGIVGYNAGELLIQNCVNYGEITNDLGTYIGGLLGRDSGTQTTTTILNSYNEGKINGTARNVGGLIGEGSGTVDISNSYNSGIININTTKNNYVGGIIGNLFSSTAMLENLENKSLISIKGKPEYANCVGGLVGRIMDNSTVKINNSNNNTSKLEIIVDELNNHSNEKNVGGIIGVNVSSHLIIMNSFNLANIEGGTKIGGILGSSGQNNAKVLIDKCYNKGNLTSNFVQSSGTFAIGGIIGYNCYAGISYITNSYNLGNLYSENKKATAISGIIGSMYSDNRITKSYIVNNYNQGSITNTVFNSYLSGIVTDFGASVQNEVYINNAYNIGDINGNKKYGISYITTGYNVNNAYFLKAEGVINSNKDVGEELTKEQFSNLFSTLNNNINNISLDDLAIDFPDYNISYNKWQIGENGYPELIL